ncbi:hypothetical protein Riv7116_2957 [Rivularia sp. PCC 7116]|uniref:hypothetical protein n=1 Tax=Rivularia sp. PCC 7116 TaxID=373994 RepID=UPI00029EF3FF|nr:hypothetical protein [Rivularia sp. PCC 7116]AFY55438.1 hypothetical protein Riv7116_2957 [Rivularia sp. PCC 7116]
MKNNTLLSIAMVVLASTTNAIPAIAQSNQPENLQTQSQTSVLPKSSALVIAFPQQVQVDSGKKKSYPMTVLLAQPILDQNGTEVVKANSPVAVELVPYKKDIKIVAKSIIVGGKVVSIQATSPVIPSQKITVKSANQKAKRNSKVSTNLGGSIVGALGGDSNSTMKGGLAGNAIGIVTGLTSAKKIRLVNIPQGSVHILELETAASLPTTSYISQTKVAPISTNSKNIISEEACSLEISRTKVKQTPVKVAQTDLSEKLEPCS